MGTTSILSVLFVILLSQNGIARTDLELEAPVCSTQCQREVRVQHARELLGRHYNQSAVRAGEDIKKVNKEIYQWTRERLPNPFKRQYKRVAKAILDEAKSNQFDPIFLASVIQSESSFVPNMHGKFGEIGLMQIKPSTGKWIAEKAKIPWDGKKTLLDPVANIRLGAAFLSYLRDRFDMHARLYLAAYNMGPRNVMSAQSRNIWPKDYPIHVMKNYVEFYTLLKSERAPAAKLN